MEEKVLAGCRYNGKFRTSGCGGSAEVSGDAFGATEVSEVSGVEVSAKVSEAMGLETEFPEVVSEAAGVSGVLWLGHL